MKTRIKKLLKEQSDLVLHCLPKPVCLKIKDHYSTMGCNITGFCGHYLGGGGGGGGSRHYSYFREKKLAYIKIYCS